MLELFHGPVSTASERARLVLEQVGKAEPQRPAEADAHGVAAIKKLLLLETGAAVERRSFHGRKWAAFWKRRKGKTWHFIRAGWRTLP